MAVEKTLFVIKPDCVRKGRIGEVVAIMERNSLRVSRMRMIRFTPELADEFYAEHIGKDFFESLRDFITSGPVVVSELEGEDAISRVREIMGATDPKDAASGTIRRKYAESVGSNCVHGSDSPESAEREIKIIFGDDK
ncbi:MAG: nucleoside-diphosphate kinase [bacterium]|nr:nucleoside-diphosphate kinase [bacterium]